MNLVAEPRVLLDVTVTFPFAQRYEDKSAVSSGERRKDKEYPEKPDWPLLGWQSMYSAGTVQRCRICSSALPTSQGNVTSTWACSRAGGSIAGGCGSPPTSQGGAVGRPAPRIRRHRRCGNSSQHWLRRNPPAPPPPCHPTPLRRTVPPLPGHLLIRQVCRACTALTTSRRVQPPPCSKWPFLAAHAVR